MVRFILVFLLVIFCGHVNGSPSDSLASNSIERYTVLYPQNQKPFQFKLATSFLFTKLPVDWVETSVDIPIIQVDCKLDLPAGFALRSTIQTIVVSNQLRIGSRWNYMFGNFYAGAGFDISFMYGSMDVAGFKNEATGWSAYPILNLGFKTGNTAFSIIGEMDNILSMNTKSGDTEISSEKNFKSGYSISIYLEQFLWKKHVMVIGVINNFQKFFYPAWPAFSTFNRRYYIPQVYLGLVL